MKKYPFDQRQAAALLEQEGWTRAGDGVLQKGGEKFNVSIRNMAVTGNVMRDRYQAVRITADPEGGAGRLRRWGWLARQSDHYEDRHVEGDHGDKLRDLEPSHSYRIEA